MNLTLKVVINPFAFRLSRALFSPRTSMSLESLEVSGSVDGWEFMVAQAVGLRRKGNMAVVGVRKMGRQSAREREQATLELIRSSSEGKRRRRKKR